MLDRKIRKATKARPFLMTASYFKNQNIVMYMQHFQDENTLKIEEEAKKIAKKKDMQQKDNCFLS